VACLPAGGAFCPAIALSATYVGEAGRDAPSVSPPAVLEPGTGGAGADGGGSLPDVAPGGRLCLRFLVAFGHVGKAAISVKLAYRPEQARQPAHQDRALQISKPWLPNPWLVGHRQAGRTIGADVVAGAPLEFRVLWFFLGWGFQGPKT
jgi:hypothetical protein